MALLYVYEECNDIFSHNYQPYVVLHKIFVESRPHLWTSLFNTSFKIHCLPHININIALQLKYICVLCILSYTLSFIFVTHLYVYLRTFHICYQ